MLSPEEFTVGTVEDAPPGSIVLPRGKYESVVLICEGEEAPVALFLGSQDGFRFFEVKGPDRWGGVIVPNVRIEIDESSVYNADIHGNHLGVLVREGPKLIVRGTAQHSFGRSAPVTVKSGLPAGKGGAAFTRWQVVIGRGDDKRVLHKVDLGDPPERVGLRRHPDDRTMIAAPIRGSLSRATGGTNTDLKVRYPAAIQCLLLALAGRTGAKLAPKHRGETVRS